MAALVSPVMPAGSPWLTLPEAAAYASGASLTAAGHVRIGARFLRKEAMAGRLRAATIGGRKQMLTRRDWVDLWIVGQMVPVEISARRRAG